MLCLLPTDTALQVFLAVRRERVNRKRVGWLACRFLLNHPAAAALRACRRPAVSDVLERDVFRACQRIAGSDDPDVTDVAYLHARLLRYAHNPVAAKRLVAGSTHGSEGVTTEYRAGATEYRAGATEYRAVSDDLRAVFAPPIERPATITAEDRGIVTGTLTALYRQTPTANLTGRFAPGLSALANRSPRFAPGFRVALVFDTSASMRGYGDREYCLAASAVTLWRLLCRVSPEPVAVFDIEGEGGELLGSLPTLGGATDLASALLAALETRPDLVVVLTDGYENQAAGDLARAAATLLLAGVATPVLMCLPVFTERDDRSTRRPAPKLPELVFWHEDELPGRGHLEQLLMRQRATLTQFRSRFECLDGQTGALFFVGERLAGVEIAPNAAYFRDIWMPLVSFAYGIAAYGIERDRQTTPYGASEPFPGVDDLAALRDALREVPRGARRHAGDGDQRVGGGSVRRDA